MLPFSTEFWSLSFLHWLDRTILLNYQIFVTNLKFCLNKMSDWSDIIFCHIHTSNSLVHRLPSFNGFSKNILIFFSALPSHLIYYNLFCRILISVFCYNVSRFWYCVITAIHEAASHLRQIFQCYSSTFCKSRRLLLNNRKLWMTCCNMYMYVTLIF